MMMRVLTAGNTSTHQSAKNRALGKLSWQCAVQLIASQQERLNVVQIAEGRKKRALDAPVAVCGGPRARLSLMMSEDDE